MEPTPLSPATQAPDIKLNIQVDNKLGPSEVSQERDLYKALENWVAKLNPITTTDKLFFFDLYGTMINAGLSILDALTLIKEQVKNPHLKLVIDDVLIQVTQGQSLANSFRRQRGLFDEATCSIIESGEKSGQLAMVLKELVAQFEKMHTIRSQVKSVMTYPIIVVSAMVLLTIAIMIFVVPNLQNLFSESGASLPWATQILISGSEFMTAFWHYVLGGIIVGGIALRQFLKTKTGRFWTAEVTLNTPIFGGIQKQFIIARVTRIFGFLMRSGVPVADSLRIAANISGNPLYQEKLLLTAQDIKQGIQIAENLSHQEKLFPNIMVSMIAIGERTASLPEVMDRVANFYEENLNRSIKNMSKLMEPIVLTVIAAGAIFMILAVYMPIMQMADLVQ